MKCSVVSHCRKKRKRSNKPSPYKRRSNSRHLDTPTIFPGTCRRGRTGKCIIAGATAKPQCMDECARASLWLRAAILRLTGNENAQIPTASTHDAPPILTRRCCQSERRRRQRRRELVMFSLYCFSFLARLLDSLRIHYTPPPSLLPLRPLSCSLQEVLISGSQMERQCGWRHLLTC